jgi:hypothetical protein
MLGLELVPLLLQFVPPFDAFLRGHEWEISHGSNHGRVVVEGEMQRHRARARQYWSPCHKACPEVSL